MERKQMVDQAIEFLQNLDLSRVERLEINNVKYDDGTTNIEISVDLLTIVKVEK